MNDDVGFESVYVLGESNHSGVLANVHRINPNNKYDKFQRLESLIVLEQYAAMSLTAYNAIEFWSLIPDGWWPGFYELRDAAQEILKRVEKPKRFLSMASQWVDVK